MARIIFHANQHFVLDISHPLSLSLSLCIFQQSHIECRKLIPPIYMYHAFKNKGCWIHEENIEKLQRGSHVNQLVSVLLSSLF